MSALPPDRSHLLTEQSSAEEPLHEYAVAQLVAHIQAADAELPAALAAAAPQITAFICAAETGFLAGGRLVYVGAGTSGRLGVLDASEIPPTFQLPAERVVGIIAGGERSLRQSSEGAEDDPHGALPALQELALGPHDSVLGIAAGGTTPYVRGALAHAAALPQPPVTGLLCCCQVAAPPGVGHCIHVLVGPEVIVGSTRMKAGSACKQVLNTISTTLMVRSGRVYGNRMVALRASNHKLCDRAARVIAHCGGCTREAAFGLLEQTQGAVIPAIVMARRGCSLAQAQQLLSSQDGRLGAWLSKNGAE